MVVTPRTFFGAAALDARAAERWMRERRSVTRLGSRCFASQHFPKSRLVQPELSADRYDRVVGDHRELVHGHDLSSPTTGLARIPMTARWDRLLLDNYVEGLECFSNRCERGAHVMRPRLLQRRELTRALREPRSRAR